MVSKPNWERIARELNDKVVLPMMIGGNHLATARHPQKLAGLAAVNSATEGLNLTA